MSDVSQSHNATSNLLSPDRRTAAAGSARLSRTPTRRSQLVSLKAYCRTVVRYRIGSLPYRCLT